MAYKFEVYKDSQGKFRFHLKAPNGQIMLQSQGYTEKHSAIESIESIQEHAAQATIEEVEK